MKKYIILPLLFLSALCWGQAQFVIQNGSKTEVYSNINDAITNAVSGDTLYIPGGGFTISNTTIEKTLHWVGHGHYPDSTSATMQSRITSSLTFTGDCDNSSFEGIYFTSGVSFGSSSDEATNIKMKRCRIGGTLYLRAVTTGNPNLNFNLTECVTGPINARDGAFCSIEKSMIFGIIYNFNNSQFSHSSLNHYISTSSSNRSNIRGTVSCTFNNNVFSYMGNLDGATLSCSFNNNLFAENLPYSPTSTHSGSNNIVLIGYSNIYTTVIGNIHQFSYQNDYHLNASSTGTTQTGTTGVTTVGTAADGTNAGVYGTAAPYKIIPYYPHINTATIATQASNNQLDVNINVQAQKR